ncbi:MAG: Putative polysaccharide export protein YccZ precursor [Rhodanobacteraceae bacterium]|nr:MAG: Putative polysaccharide export protein YccZ precursor [Rhodanobacteraceae bacterium]
METSRNPLAEIAPRLRAAHGLRARNVLGGLLALVLCTVMAGCVPGQDMSMSVRGENANSDYVHLVPITPQLIATQIRSDVPEAIPAALADYQPQPYEVGPGDSLYITVWEHPELTSPAGTQQETAANGRVVRPDGTIYFPFAGTVHAAGKTVEQLRQLLTRKLSTYIKNPQVDVNVVAYNSQHVLMEGAFTKTGPQAITTVPLTLGEAMGTATVDVPNANLSDVLLSRDGTVYHLDMDSLAQNDLAKRIYLKAGDRVYLPYNDRQEIYVMGEVNRPEAIRFKTADLTLTQAIGQAGGLNQVTSKGKIYVIRDVTNQGSPHATVYELDAKSAVAFAVGSQFRVKPGDVVFASSAGVTKWNRFLTQLLPITSALSATASANYYIQHP